VYLPLKQLIFCFYWGKIKNPFSRFTHVAAGAPPQNPPPHAELEPSCRTATHNRGANHAEPIASPHDPPNPILSPRSITVHTCHGTSNHSGFRTGQVYKPGPESLQSIAAVRREETTVGSHPFPTAPEPDIKTFPSAPTTYIQSSSNPVCH